MLGLRLPAVRVVHTLAADLLFRIFTRYFLELVFLFRQLCVLFSYGGAKLYHPFKFWKLEKEAPSR